MKIKICEQSIKKMKLGVATFTLIVTTAASTLIGCTKKNNNTNKPTPTKTIEMITPTESVTPTITPTNTPIPTITPTNTPTPTVTPIPTEAITPTPIVEEKNKEEKIFKFFNEKKEELKEALNSENVEKFKEKGRKLFITLVDFIFYDGKIKGVTYDELNEAARKQLFDDLCTIDEFICKYIPDYKENIGSKYNTIKNFISPRYYKVLSKIKELIGSDNLEKINEIIEQDKSIISDLLGKGKQKIQEKYENWRDKEED